MEKEVAVEKIKVAGGKLVDTIKKVVKEGNVRRVVVRNAEGRALIDMPLTAGVASAVLFPFFTAAAGLVSLAKEFTVEVERRGD